MGLTYKEIVQRLGISYGLAGSWCRRTGYVARLLPRGPPSVRQMRLARVKRLPPRLTIRQVARRLGIALASAQYWIHEAGYAFRRRRRGNQKVSPGQWRNVDWIMRDVRIARMLGL